MKQSTRSVVKLFGFISAVCGATLSAKSAMALPRTHDGFYMQLDAGLGYLGTSVSAGGTTEKLSGLTFPTAILLGGTVGPVVIGGGLIMDYAASPSYSVNGQSAPVQTGVHLYMLSMGVFADIYPNPTGGFHIQPFLGFGSLQLEYNGFTSNSATGLALAVGVGYDWWVADEWSIGVMGRLAYAPLSYSGVGYSTFAPALLATFTYH